MNVNEQIAAYISGHPARKQAELNQLHQMIAGVSPGCKMWFLDGTDSTGKVVTNPDIGYGSRMLKYPDGSTREFYRVGLSPTKTGISIYIMGVEDKKYLSDTFGKTIGKAIVTGYCIKFRTVKDIDLGVLESAVRFGFEIP